MNEIDISVIVTTKNEEENIGDCLRSIKSQSYPQDRLELIVVDNNSTDDTKSIASEFTSRVYNLGPERSAQRNFGVSKARGKYIVYLDADMTLNEDVLSQSFLKCEEEGFSALHIPEKIIGKGFWISVRDFERSFYNETVIDCVRFVSKEECGLIADLLHKHRAELYAQLNSKDAATRNSAHQAHYDCICLYEMFQACGPNGPHEMTVLVQKESK